MKHISLFSGIGGFNLAAEWMGWINVASCEFADFPTQVMQKHWPQIYHHKDIKDLTGVILNEEISTRYGNNWRANGVILTGGFPCQPYSLAGKRLGTADDRHLWPEMLRIICEVQPDYVVAENVRGLITWNEGLVFDEVQSDLETAGYEVLPFILPASAVGAPHRRDRVWFIAKNTNSKFNGGLQASRYKSINKNTCTASTMDTAFAANTNGVRLSGRMYSQNGAVTIRNEFKQLFSRQNPAHAWQDFPTQSPLCGRNDGISNRVDRLKSLGNAIVPQVAFQIFKAIDATHNFI
jgi:DNA (cytosine-5)-methyltransferase 1